MLAPRFGNNSAAAAANDRLRVKVHTTFSSVVQSALAVGGRPFPYYHTQFKGRTPLAREGVIVVREGRERGEAVSSRMHLNGVPPH